MGSAVPDQPRGSSGRFIIGLLAQAGQSTGNELALPWAPATIVTLTVDLAGARLACPAGPGIHPHLADARPYGCLEARAGFAACLGLALTVSLTSHAATEAAPALPVLDDWIHVTGMTFWFGGLACLLTGLRELRSAEGKLRTRLTSLTMVRFSAMALVSVGLIGVTGLYSASLRVGRSQHYSVPFTVMLLLFKQIFVVALLAHCRHQPGLDFPPLEKGPIRRRQQRLPWSIGSRNGLDRGGSRRPAFSRSQPADLSTSGQDHASQPGIERDHTG